MVVGLCHRPRRGQHRLDDVNVAQMILAVACFLMAAFADVLWAKYTIYAAQKRAFLAAVWGALIIPAGAISIIAYTENHWYLIASILGAFVGTYGAVKRHKD